jgi:PleD family two-component response regulator
MADAGHVLNGWKEIAQYLGRGIRTVQRWESMYGMPVHRPAAKDRSAVTAFPSEIDNWLKFASLRGAPYVRPTILILDQPITDAISNRKLAAEIAKFNVLTAFTVEEMRATAQKFDVDAFVTDLTLPDASVVNICKELKERYPNKPVIAVGTEPSESEADHFVEVGEIEKLTKLLIQVVGRPRIVPDQSGKEDRNEAARAE